MRITLHQQKVNGLLPTEKLKIPALPDYPLYANDQWILLKLNRFFVWGEFIMPFKSGEARHLFSLIKLHETTAKDLDDFFLNLIEKHGTETQYRAFTKEAIRNAYEKGYEKGTEEKMTEIRSALGLKAGKDLDIPW